MVRPYTDLHIILRTPFSILVEPFITRSTTILLYSRRVRNDRIQSATIFICFRVYFPDTHSWLKVKYARHQSFLGENDEFGELALLDSEPCSASVTAVEETYLLRLDQKTFYELISDYPDVLRGIIQVLSERLRETTRLAMMAGTAPPTNAP